MVLDPIKTALQLGAITFLPESSYIEIGRCGEVAFSRVSYFAVEEISSLLVLLSTFTKRLSESV
jgi:hypothetical protein